MSVLDAHLKYTANTEPPIQFHRWAFLSCIGAMLGKNVWIEHGHYKIYPNMYTLLVGVPGTRKSTAIGMAKKLLSAADYNKFAYDKTSKEKFLLDFETGFDSVTKSSAEAFKAALDKPFEPGKEFYAEAFICADEFPDFIGPNNTNFTSLLTILWDAKDEPYSERLKNSKSVTIHNPVVNILGGITPTSLAYTLPAETIGQGFMSRMLLIYSDPRGKKVTWPPPPDKALERELVDFLNLVRSMRGPCSITPGAAKLIDRIYQSWQNLPDARLQYYCSRRLTHLFKVCMVCAVCHGSTTVTEVVVVMANTILTYAERNMHRALGEFGDARNSKAVQKVMETIAGTDTPLGIDAIWKAVSTDLNRVSELMEILQNLMRSEKLESIEVAGSYKFRLPVKGQSPNVVAVDYALWIPEYEEETQDQLLTINSALAEEVAGLERSLKQEAGKGKGKEKPTPKFSIDPGEIL